MKLTISSLQSFHALDGACKFPLLHFIFSLCWVYAASAPSLASECVFWTVLFPPELCAYKSSHILEPIPWQHTVLHCKNKNVQNSSKTLQLLLLNFPFHQSTGEQLHFSFLFSYSRWFASVITILAYNEKHNCMAAGGIDVITVVPGGQLVRSQRKQHSPTREVLNKFNLR